MGQIYLVASGKGGVGKTTVTANIAACLAKSGNRVLCFDGDIYLKNLDILMNKQDESVFDIQDMYLSRRDFDKAVLEHEEIKGLFFVPAPSLVEEDAGEIYSYMMKLAVEISENYDFIFIDCPAGLSAVKTLMTPDAVLLVVATPDLPSVRGAEKIAEIAYAKGARARLIVNKVRPDMIKKKLAPNIDEIIDDTTVRLIGLIPDDKTVLSAAAKGSVLCLEKKSDAEKAVENISARLCGATVPLMKL